MGSTRTLVSIYATPKVKIFASLKVSLADIKNDLPLWPDEVIKLWLFYLANRARGDPSDMKSFQAAVSTNKS
jgi:hypothetical protein